ncbi:MAG: recombination mediator RecR [Alphaproteobacteria bacterium]
MTGSEIEHLIRLLAKLPGLGPRSARRATLHLLKRKESLLKPLAEALGEAGERVHACGRCGNLDSHDPCAICADPRRDQSVICVVEEVADLWALERAGAFRGRYHVLGGVLSALDGVGPEDLNIAALVARVVEGQGQGEGQGECQGAQDERVVREVILATNATVDGQTTAHYIIDRLADSGVEITRPAHGMPVGGELDYLDDGTLTTALKSRRPF